MFSSLVNEEKQLAQYSNDIDNYVNNSREYLNVKSGTYTGTGTNGESNPNTLTFDEAPQMIMIMPTDLVNGTHSQNLLLIQGCTSSGINTVSSFSSDTGVNRLCLVTWSNNGKTVSWYGPGVYNQLNYLNTVYKWVAIF